MLLKNEEVINLVEEATKKEPIREPMTLEFYRDAPNLFCFSCL